MAKKSSKTKKQPTYSSIADISKSNAKRYGQERQGTTGEKKTGVMFNTVTGNDYIKRISEQNQQIREDSQRRQAERQKQIQRNYATLMAGVKLNMSKDAQKAQSAAPVRSMINGIDRLSGGLTDRQKFELTRSLTTGKEPAASPVPANSAIVKDQRGILESYINQRAQKAKEYKAQKDLTFQGLRENMEAGGGNDQFGVDDYIGIKQQNKRNQQQGLHDSGTDPRNMSDEGLEKYRSGFQTKYDTAMEDIKSLSKQKEMRDSYIPWQGWGNQVYDYIHDLAIQNEDAILNGEGYSDEEKRNAWWTKTELQDKYQSGLDEALEDARTFYNNEYIGGGFAGTGYDQQNMRELAYEQIMGEKYADSIAKMTPAQKTELDSRIDQAIGGFTNPYASDIDYDAEMQSRAKEAAAYQREVQQAEELQAQRSQLDRYGQQADQTGFSGEYNPELNPEIKMVFNDMYHDDVPSPQGSEADKAYFWANNYQNYPELINSYTEPNKYMFIGAMGDDVLKRFNKLYEFDKVNGTRAAESFMQALDPYLSTFLTEYQDWYTRSNSSGWKGFIGRVMSYPMNLWGGLMGTAGTAAAALGVESAQDKSSGWYSTTRAVNALRSQQNEDVGDWVARITNSDDAGQIAQRVLGVVDSIGDNLFSMGTGTALSPNSTNAAMRMVQLIMSGEATSSRMVEMLDKNMDPTKAALYSIGDGVIEWLTERYSLERIMGPDVKQLLGNKKALRSFIARSAAAEGSEEVASNLLNTVLDSVLSKIYEHETEIEERYNDLIASGMGEQSAWQQALKEKMEDVGWDFLGGAFSGGLMAGGRVITNKANQRYEGKQIRKNSSAKQLYDLAMDMDEGSDSRKLAEQIQVSEAGDVQAKDYELGRLAQALAQETGEKYNATIKSTIETDVKQKLHEAGVYRNADEYAAIIANTLFSDGKMDSKDKQTLARDERAVKVWKKYNMPDESNAQLNKTIRDNTQPQRNVMDQLSRMTRRSDSKAEINNPAGRSGTIAKFATPAEIREAESRSQRTGGQREVIVDGQFANVKQIRVEQKNGKWKAKVELENGKTVDTSQLLATNYGMAQIINQAAISPEFYSERFTNLLIKAQEEGRLGDPDSALNDATKIRIAAYIGNTVPQTGLDRQLANEIWAESTREHAENRAAQTKDAGAQKKGTVKFGDAEYGTTEWNEAVKKLDPALRSAVDYVSSIFRAADIEANITDMQDDSVYGTYNTTDKGITINLFGKNFTLDGQATGRHNIVVTASHELTHWLKENSMAAYNRLEQYVMQQYAKKDYNGLVKRLNYFMYQDGLSLEDAMDEIVANSSDQVLGDEKTVEHIRQTDGKLFGQIRGFVQNLVERMKKAIAGMRDSASKDARFMLANRVNQINKLWTGAWDEALSNMAKETTQQTQPAEAQVKNSKAETAAEHIKINNQARNEIYQQYGINENDILFGIEFNDDGTVAYDRHTPEEAALIRRIGKENLQTLREIQEDTQKWRKVWKTDEDVYTEDYYENAAEIDEANKDETAELWRRTPEAEEKYAVPVKRYGTFTRLDTRTLKMDAEYAKAVQDQDWAKAEQMLLDKYNMKEMTTFGSVVGYRAPYYFNGDHAEIAKQIKEGDPEVVHQAAEEMAPKVPENAVLIPMPPHTGKVTEDTDTMILAKAIGEITGRPVLVALESEEHTSRREAKKTGEKVYAPDLGMRQIADIPEGMFPVFIDNVVGGGTTALAARDAIGHGITLAYAQSSRGKIAGAKYLSVTRDADGNLIPLSQRINPDNPSWKYSKAEESQALDAGMWLATVSPFSGLQTADERALQEAYKGLRTSISLSLLKQSQYKEKIRQYESRGFLDSEDQNELDTLREKLEKEQNHLVDLENRMHEVQSSEGYAGIMYSGNMIIRDFVQGRTGEQVMETVNQMLDEVKAANEQIRQQAEELKLLEQTQAVKTMKSFMGKTSLDQQAGMLRKQYNSTMNKQEIQDRLAAMALKLAAGQDIQTDAEALATDLVDKIRGIRSENLESLRGMTLNIGQNLLKELKAENSSLKEIRNAIYGSGVKIKTEGNSRLVEQWNEIRNNNQSLPDIDGMPEIDALHTIIDYISGELQASSGSQQFDVNMEEAAAICYGAAASVTTYMVKDPAAKKQITELMAQIKELSQRTGAIAEGMDELSRKMEDVVSAGYKAAGWSDTLYTDMNNAIKYYNKVAELAAKEERTKVRKNLIEQLRSENAKKLYEMQDKYEQQLKDSRKARETVEENQTLRNRINTNISRLRKRLTEETDKQNIPEETKALARYLCGKLVNHDMTDGLRRVLFADKKQLQDFSERLKRMDAEDGGFDADRDLDWLVIKAPDPADNDYTLRDKVVQDLRSIDNGLLMYWTAEGNGLNSLQNRRDALKEISDAVAEITSAIRARGQAFINNKRYELADLAERAEDEMSRSRFKGERYGRGSKTKNAIEKGIGYGNLTPEYFFKNLKNSVFDLLHKGFNNAENRSGLMAADVQARMEEIAEQTGYRTWDGKEKHQIAVSGGQTIDVTTEQLMALYATWQREKNNLRPEATAHLLKGGFVLAPEDRSTGKPGRERIQQRPVRMSKEQLDKLGEQLTDQQSEYVDKIVQYMSTDLAEVANETSMETYGIRKFTEKYYFPIKSWGGVLRHESNQGVTNKNENAAMRQSFTKWITAGAQNTIEIGDFTPTAMKHIAGMITFNTVGPAVENLNKVLNYQLKYGDVTYNEGGEVEEDNTYKRSVEAAFQEAYGKNALDYLKQFMKDINGGTAQGIGNTVFDKLLSTFRKGAVAGSLSVALQQPLSYIRAATMINPKYLASAIAPWHWSRIHEEMTKYSGIAVIKDMGRFDMQLGRSMLDYITPDAKESGLKTAWTKFSDATTILPEKMDAITWGRMWIACKMEQAAQHPEMDQNSDEFLETVAERFNEVMRRTQVYDSVMVKSQNMRTKNMWFKSITSFMAEPTLSLNVLEDAVRNRKEQGGKLYLARAGATFIMSAVAQALVKGIMSSGRSPDDKKTWMEQFLAKWFTNAWSEINPFSLVPGYSDLVEVLKKGELSNDAIGVLGKLKSILQASFNGIAGKGKGAYRDIEDTVGQVVQIFSNIPLKNMMRDARAMYNFFNPETYAQRATSGTVIKYGVIDAAANADNMIGVINTYLQMAESGYGTSNSAYYKRIYEAKKAKEAGRAEELTEYMLLGKGVKEETITENLKKNVKADTSLTVAEQDDWMIDNDLMGENNTGTITTQYKEGKLTKAEAAKLYKKLNPKLTDNDVWWKFDQMEYNKETGANVSGDARYYRLKDAINANKSEQISKAIKDLREHGMEQRKIKDELSKWKSEYLAGDLDTRKRIRGALEKAYVALGLNGKEVDTLLSNWKKDKSKATTTYKDTIGRYGKGNIDLNNRKVVRNEDGSISTEESITVTIDGKYWVIPTIIDGKRVSEQEAIDYAIRNNKYLGKFDKLKDAEKYAEDVHNRQDWYYHK